MASKHYPTDGTVRHPNPMPPITRPSMRLCDLSGTTEDHYADGYWVGHAKHDPPGSFCFAHAPKGHLRLNHWVRQCEATGFHADLDGTRTEWYCTEAAIVNLHTPAVFGTTITDETLLCTIHAHDFRLAAAVGK